MTLPHHFQKRLSLPVIAAPLFLASGPKLVLACCRAGIIGTLPAKNQRTLAGFEEWLNEICDGLASIERETGFPPAPFGVNLIVHQTNKNLKKELDLCVKYRVPLIITSLGAVSRVVDKVVSPTKFACAGISTTFSPSFFRNIIPELGSAGCSVKVAFFPVCKPTPVAEVLFLIVLCASIGRYFRV